jgi:membrane glycosyltransferase
MLIQSQQVWEILRGRDSGWSAQQREYKALPWRTLLDRHGWHTVIGLALAAALFYVATPLLAWMSPTVVGLALAVPLSALSGSIALAKLLGFFRLMTTPEEVAPPPIMATRDRFEQQLRAEVEAATLDTLIRQDLWRRRHFEAVVAPPQPPRGCPDVRRASVALKIADAAHVEEAISWFSAEERMTLLSHTELFDSLLALGFGRPRRDDGGLVAVNGNGNGKSHHGGKANGKINGNGNESGDDDILDYGPLRPRASRPPLHVSDTH